MHIHFIITGFVQGVGFRKFVKHTARVLGLKGWVRNNHDGSVEGVVVGQKEKLEKMIKACRKGPLLSEVENVELEWIENGEEFEVFEVRH